MRAKSGYASLNKLETGLFVSADTTLKDLPLEILYYIASYLTLDDFFSLSASCRLFWYSIGSWKDICTIRFNCKGWTILCEQSGPSYWRKHVYLIEKEKRLMSVTNDVTSFRSRVLECMYKSNIDSLEFLQICLEVISVCFFFFFF